MKTPLFTGVCTALVTPFLNGQVNYPMLQRLIIRQYEAGVRALVICGTTGESPTLSDAEKLELFRRAREYAPGDCLIIAGTGSNDTRHAAALSLAAQDQGADALLLVSPYYNKATAEGLVQHFAHIASQVEIPCILYNVPSRTGVDIPVAVYRQLSRIPNIAGVKEASSDIGKTAAVLESCGEDFALWTGNDDQILPVMALGGKGVISVLSNPAPELTCRLCRAMLEGDLETARALRLHLQPLARALFLEVNPIPVKAAMEMLGYACGGCRLPLTALRPENGKILEKALSDL